MRFLLEQGLPLPLPFRLREPEVAIATPVRSRDGAGHGTQTAKGLSIVLRTFFEHNDLVPLAMPIPKQSRARLETDRASWVHSADCSS